MTEEKTPAVTLEAGTYEILRQRLTDCGRDLRERLERLNEARQEVFGTIETALVATDRVTTDNNCLPRDLVAIGANRFLFGYNVHLGLRTETQLEDVFSAFAWEDRQFKPVALDFLRDETFLTDFRSLFKYYRNTVFAKFGFIGPHLFFVFQTGQSVTDIKTFKWALDHGSFIYLGNRSDHEFVFPAQHEFEWKRTHRDLHRDGLHPHISIEDRLFVETVGGDLTIKVEDNTATGAGIYAEPVEHRDQTLDDAEIFYAALGNLILLKIRPYQEKAWRYFVFNDKLDQVRRIDAIEQSCVLLPDGHGIIFSRGYYLQSGELKVFDANSTDMLFERRIQAPNREDFLYIFYNRERGDYILMPYNLITQRVETPVHCHGFSLFENGEMALFKSEPGPQKHHTVQIWQTPFTGPAFNAPQQGDSFLFKIGNGDLVRGMAECHEILALTQRDDSYSGLYVDLEKRAGALVDSYFWLGREETFNLKEPLLALQNAAARTVDEFDKVLALRRHADEAVARTSGEAEAVLGGLLSGELQSIEAFVEALGRLRSVRGELITLKGVRYADVVAVEDLETKVAQRTDAVSADCVQFLLRDEALEPYRTKAASLDAQTAEISRVADGRLLEASIAQAGGELEMLIEVVGNLRIEDATETTRIVDQISAVYASLNQVLARLRQRLHSLQSEEGAAQFAAQLRLISQSVANALERCDSPEKCDDALGRLMVQLEELEGRFAEFDTYLIELAEKRTEITSAFEAKKLALVEGRNRRASSLLAVADRLLASIAHRVAGLTDVNAINGFYASDQMVDRLRGVAAQLLELGDPVKADDINSRLKTAREDAVRQLKDQQELFVGNGNVVAFGPHHFNVNTQPIELTVVERENSLAVHLSGTRFFERIDDEDIVALRGCWNLEVVSESPVIYRGEYLAYQFLRALETEGRLAAAADWTDAERLKEVQEFMAPRYAEAYVKGVHDEDAAKLLGALLSMHLAVGLLRFHPEARVLAVSAWQHGPGEEAARLRPQLESFGVLRKVFPGSERQQGYIGRLEAYCRRFAQSSGLFLPDRSPEAAEYLFEVLCHEGEFSFSHEAYEAYDAFTAGLRKHHASERFEEARHPVRTDFVRHFELLRDWLDGFFRSSGQEVGRQRDETVLLLLRDLHNRHEVEKVALSVPVSGLLGQHAVIQDGRYELDYLAFMDRLAEHERQTVPEFERFQNAKRRVLEEARTRLRTGEFKPRVLSSFVRNQLVDRVFLPLIGANLAKQMGTAGENTRTDRMGLLLLISPPGYGKTTLMEYVASRLGVVFMKINGPAIGHQVTSLDPAEAPNAAAREELVKLNLSFEMGDNIMIYLDDIQHCHPEFLQKFIALCDGQRRIEGVYRGVARTYDFRGRKVAVVMAGNPYTESGEKFRIPDMLSNRADTYNLGDIAAGAHFEAFKLSYLENALTSNPQLNALSSRSRTDVLGIVKIAETGSSEGVDLEGGYAARELEDLVAVMKKLLRIRDVILKVNAEYIRSAGQAEAYRTEPPFLLQGSYRNMNRLAEKVLPVMDDKELEELLADHYRNEAQTLTTGAEANLLRWRELLGVQTEEQAHRWEEIKKTFRRNLFTGDDEDPVSRVVGQLAGFQQGLESIRDVLQAGARAMPQPTAATLPSSGERVPVSPETLRQIWELIEKDKQRQDSREAKPGDQDAFIEMPKP